MKKITIAIDGFSSCGKSTMAKDLARRVGYIYVDTGAMYRSVTLFALRNNLFAPDGSILEEELRRRMPDISISFRLNEQTGRPDTYLNGELVEHDIRSMEVSNRVSPVAALPFVRTEMVRQQQRMGAEKGIVMDGRDIGTVVFPDAELKIFVTASAEVRAQRRYDELKAKGMEADFNDILKNVQERDYIDSHREVSPLRKADDALELDNSHMTIDEQNQWLMQRFEERTSEKAADRDVVAEGIGKVLRKVAPHNSRAILFGSRARGDARKDSDWDVLILLDKDRITPADLDEISYPIREFGWEIDKVINPIMYTQKEWESKSFTPFYKNIMEEGVAL